MRKLLEDLYGSAWWAIAWLAYIGLFAALTWFFIGMAVGGLLRG